MVEFAGYLMPLVYTGIAEEHAAVRESSGLFDVSHMGEIRIRGRMPTVSSIISSPAWFRKTERAECFTASSWMMTGAWSMI